MLCVFISELEWFLSPEMYDHVLLHCPGIGYFTLPYLVHAKAAHVHACEWNPYAVKALQRNLQINGVSDRCTIHQGDNGQVRITALTLRYKSADCQYLNFTY